MDNDLNSWRAAIGTFYSKTNPIVLTLFTTINLLNYIINVSNAIKRGRRGLRKCIGSSVAYDLNIYLAIVSVLIILLAGDVAENPGPDNYTQYTGSLSILYGSPGGTF